MIIIVEGPDGAGKTTLIKQIYEWLSKDDDTTVVHHGPYKGVGEGEMARIYFNAMSPALTYGKHVIFDRSWVSDPIYGEVYRGGQNRIPLHQRRMLERAALSRGGVMISCRPSFEACAEAFNSGREEYLDNEEQLKQVYDKYTAWERNFTSMPLIEYNYEQDTTQTILNELELHQTQNPYGGGGEFMLGNVLVLCSKWKMATSRPCAVVVPYVNFTDMRPDAPATIIANEFERVNLVESDLYWVNVESTSGVALSTKIVHEMRPRRIIAIGSQPKQWCLSNGIDAEFVTHPGRGLEFNLGEVE